MPWWLWLIVAWLVLSFPIAVGVGKMLKRRREEEERRQRIAEAIRLTNMGDLEDF